jgi:hypothetical protein
MPSPITTEELLDLRFLPAWVNEPVHPGDYADFEGEDSSFGEGGGRRRPKRREGGQRPGKPEGGRGPQSREQRPRHERRNRGGMGRREEQKPHGQARPVSRPPVRPFPVNVRFLPHLVALNSVIAQIKSGSVGYSVFALARLFLEKPERYDVQLTTTPEGPLFQLGENGAVASDRTILEGSAFSTFLDDFYTTDVTQNEPLKGNFTNVARCRLSGTLLGPTNHHNYQPQLRTLYETRFSRRMSFLDYQSQIEIVSDPAVVEQWKEQARNVTTYRSKTDESTFSNLVEVERHFRKNHLPGLLRSNHDLTIGGVLSRRLSDRPLGRAIEEAWVLETRSPSKMMQELTTRLRQGSLNIFRHRRGMLFVSPIRPRAFSHESTGVSPSINAIFEKVAATPGINRKQLAEQLTPTGDESDGQEHARLTLAADLHWLVSEGYVIEFNDNSLDLPRTKHPVSAGTEESAKAEDELKPTELTSEGQPLEQNSSEVTIEPVQNSTVTTIADQAPEPIKTDTESLPAT